MKETIADVSSASPSSERMNANERGENEHARDAFVYVKIYAQKKDVCIRQKGLFKDGAYLCYYAYVLRISRYSGFLWVVPTNTGIFLRG